VRGTLVLALGLCVAGCRRPRPGDAVDAGNAATTAASSSVSVIASVSSAPADVLTHASPTSSSSAPAPKVVAIGEAIDGAALRAKNRVRLAERSPVTILRGDSPLELGRRLCEEVVPQRPKETPILLKPNLGGFDWFKDPKTHGGDDGVHGRITDPEFVRGVIRCLKARGHQKITVAEGWGAKHADWVRLVEVSGYAAMTHDEGVALVAMDDDGVFDVELDRPGQPLRITGMEQTSVPTLLMPRVLAEHLAHGLFISLPKVKAHRFGVVSMSVKGMQGTVMMSDAAPAFRQKWRMHREINPLLKTLKEKDTPAWRKAYVEALEAFGGRITDVLEIEAPHVVLADGAPAMSGDGFQQLWPSGEHFAIGGVNPILVDRVGAQLLGLWDNASLARELGGHATSPLLEAAAQRMGLDLATVDVRGDGKDLLATPRPVHYVSIAGFVLQSDGVPAPPPPIAPIKAKTQIATTAQRVHAAPLRDESITIDGDGNDAPWKRATPASWETDWAGDETGIPTRARFVWTKGALYALFELEEAGLNVDTNKPVGVERPKLYVEDCVELFVAPDPKLPSHYYEVEVGPFGHFFDLEVYRTLTGGPKKEDAGWSSEATIATRRDAAKKTATIEFVIRAPAIVRALAPSVQLPVGIFRMEGASPRHYLAWSPTKTQKPNFHVPAAFGMLVADP
jgi:uncharacterized protein (DUF362 family)